MYNIKMSCSQDHSHGQDLNLYSDNSAIRTQIRWTKPLGHGTSQVFTHMFTLTSSIHLLNSVLVSVQLLSLSAVAKRSISRCLFALRYLAMIAMASDGGRLIPGVTWSVEGTSREMVVGSFPLCYEWKREVDDKKMKMQLGEIE